MSLLCNTISSRIATEKPIIMLKQNEFPSKDHVSLVERTKPTNFDSYVGQKQVIGPKTILRCLLEKGEVPSMILWGPSGCGKTSLVNVIIQSTKEKFQDNVHVVKLIATSSGIGEVRKAVEVAKNVSVFGQRTIVCIDEIHRFNKLQQDILLPHIEAGTFIFIGTTMENPSYSLNSALLSRCRIFVLNKLTVSDINEILEKGIRFMDGRICKSNESNDASKFIIHNSTIKWLSEVCDGDAQVALNGLELAVRSKHLSFKSRPVISLEDIKHGLTSTHVFPEKSSGQIHHLYSAVHISIYAGEVNAALYWLARILAIKEDPVDIARRLVRISSEDIGLADPDALGIAVNTLKACQMIGMPECDVIMAQCVIYLAKAPKSHLVFNALSAAKKVISDAKCPQSSVPQHIKCRSEED